MSAIVRFDQVGKRFRRGHMHATLHEWLSDHICGLFRRNPQREDQRFWALQDVSFAVGAGEALGIIGPNGAGKSTALKLLAGILRPDAGSMEVRGRVSALIEVNAGLHGDLTGLENIYLSGSILGMSRREIAAKCDDIIAFSGLEKFIHTPVKRYSTGMQARLGFSTAAHVEPDLMLVDEVLSVGDIAFRQRCEDRMAQLVAEGTALIFVTHNLEQMRSVCKRTLVLDRGCPLYLGDPAEAVSHYMKAVMHRTGELTTMDHPREETLPVTDINLEFLDVDGEPVRSADPRDPIHLEMSFHLSQPVRRLTIETGLRRAGYEMIVSLNSRRQQITFDAEPGWKRVGITLPQLPLAAGTYLAFVRLWDADRAILMGETPCRFSLQVEDCGTDTGLVAFEHTWSKLEAIDAVPSTEESLALSA